MNEAKYKLDYLLQGLEMVSTDFDVYMNKHTQEFVLISDEDIRTYESQEEGETQNLLKWEKDMTKIINEVVYDTKAIYIKLPSAYDLHEHKIMENFSYTLSDALKTEFLAAIFKKGAFRNFHNLLIHYNLSQSWFDYKKEVYLNILAEWCESEGLACE
jgi:hypothetical protein